MRMTATLLLLMVFAGGASAKSHAKSHKTAAHKAAAHKASTQGLAYGKTTAATALADELAQQYNLPKAWVREQISKAQFLKGVPKMVLPPSVPTAKNWRAYRERFIESRRIDAGTQFWQTHQAALARAEHTYGVPAEMIVGVIGVETFYGQNMGNYRVLDALTTLTLNFPSAHPRAVERQAFFKSELGHFLAQAHSQGDVSAKGSFAGAMGWPQFMPSSTAKFAVDFDGDGRIDLRHNPVDAIGSVANYFKAFGWQTGMPTHYPVGFDETRLDKPTLLAPDILPSFSVSNFTAKGAVLDEQAQQHNGLLALVELFNGNDAPSYVAGTDNFYVVTRYNWSSYYALAVIELGQAVKANRASNSVVSNAR
ncbi:lytic murein transglycosylase B [Limnohabitans sp.]|uniref:lytic murein transglycosylase B n=1 Tax=Limnohabitans sp. TaxID=1907725 RepID=UPI003FA523A6